MKGGYFRADINDQVSLLSFNSLPYNSEANSALIAPQAAAD